MCWKWSNRKCETASSVYLYQEGYMMPRFQPPCINPTAASIFFNSLSPCLWIHLSHCLPERILCWCFCYASRTFSPLNLDFSLDGESLMDLIPRSCKFPLNVVHHAQVLSMESLQREGVISEPFRPDSGRQPITAVWQEEKLLELSRNISLTRIWSCRAESLMMLSVKWCFQGLYLSTSLLKNLLLY